MFHDAVVPLFNGHSCIQTKVSTYQGCPLIRGTDILEWGVGGVVGGFSYGYEKYVKKKTCMYVCMCVRVFLLSVY